jgi:hypothetical protein
LTATCAASKWIRTAAVPNATSSATIAAIQHLFDSTIYPRAIITDGGSTFTSKEFKQFCHNSSIIHCVSPHYASQYNGWLERPHETILSQLRLLLADHPDTSWTTLIHTATHLANSRPYDLDDPTGICPLHIVYGNSKYHTQLQLAMQSTEPEVEEAIKATIGHMIHPGPRMAQHLYELHKEARHAALERYLDIFRAKRLQAKERTIKHLGHTINDYCPIGSWARVYRPTPSKLTSDYTIPRLIVEKPSQSTRLVEGPDGKRSLEYLANLRPTQSYNGHESESRAPTVP